MSRWVLFLAPVFLCLAVSDATGQPAVRRLTTIESLRQFPGYYHTQNVLVRGEFTEVGGRPMLTADGDSMPVVLGDVRTASGLVEVRGQMLDVGRLEPRDPRLARYEGARDPENWPKPGEELVLTVTAVASVETAVTASVRALSLEPWKFEGQPVTVIGQFRGRNLFGDQPGTPAKSRYDFVLRTTEGAIWVTGLRPRGRGFDLDVDTRADTNQWVQVTGTVKRERTLVTIEATAIAAAQPPAIQTAASDETPAVPLRPAEVVFSSPTEGETAVPLGTVIRLQFSRGLDPASVEGNIRVRVGSADPAAPPPSVQTTYDPGNRAVSIRFSQPVQSFSNVLVETLPGLKAFDGADVTPWKLSFSFGS